eukprot:1803933-Pyramimonas_sp.AAC.1
MYVLAPLDIRTHAPSYIRLAMFIGDLLLQCHGRSFSPIVSHLSIAARSMADCIIHELKCHIASKKSQVLASHQALQDQLRTKLGPLAGPNPDRSGPNLG